MRLWIFLGAIAGIALEEVTKWREFKATRRRFAETLVKILTSLPSIDWFAYAVVISNEAIAFMFGFIMGYALAKLVTEGMRFAEEFIVRGVLIASEWERREARVAWDVVDEREIDEMVEKIKQKLLKEGSYDPADEVSLRALLKAMKHEENLERMLREMQESNAPFKQIAFVYQTLLGWSKERREILNELAISRASRLKIKREQAQIDLLRLIAELSRKS